jgi:hypothetical protein
MNTRMKGGLHILLGSVALLLIASCESGIIPDLPQKHWGGTVLIQSDSVIVNGDTAIFTATLQGGGTLNNPRYRWLFSPLDSATDTSLVATHTFTTLGEQLVDFTIFSDAYPPYMVTKRLWIQK